MVFLCSFYSWCIDYRTCSRIFQKKNLNDNRFFQTIAPVPKKRCNNLNFVSCTASWPLMKQGKIAFVFIFAVFFFWDVLEVYASQLINTKYTYYVADLYRDYFNTQGIPRIWSSSYYTGWYLSVVLSCLFRIVFSFFVLWGAGKYYWFKNDKISSIELYCFFMHMNYSLRWLLMQMKFRTQRLSVVVEFLVLCISILNLGPYSILFVCFRSPYQ